MVDWLAEDSAGNRSISTQRLKINPQLLLSQGQSTAENNVVQVVVNLSGDAAEYPVQIPFSISGTVGAEDYQIVGSESESESESYEVVGDYLNIYQGHFGVVRIEILDDAVTESDEVLEFDLGIPTNAVVLDNTKHRIVITENNLAPKVLLQAQQLDNPVTTVTWNDGPVTIALDVSDANPNDSLQVDWGVADIAQISIDPDTFTLILAPSVLPIGIYNKSVTVTDDGSPSLSQSKTINLNVIAAAPSLSAAADSDGDGINDAEEGFQDSDMDGIPDYLDNLDSLNLLQQTITSSNAEDGTFVMETEAGIHLTLGTMAITGEQSGALLSDETLQTSTEYLTHGADSNYNHIGGLYDFILSELHAVGDSVRVVIPQQASIPVDAVYRKLHPTNGWFSFVSNTSNKLYSSPGSEGVCPSPSDSSYVEGLNLGDWCVMMLIEDGGPNDIDDSANGQIVDPGGVSSPLAISTVSIPVIGNIVEGGSIALTATIVDNGNNITSYLWEQTAGSSVSITNNTQLNANVDAMPAGSYSFRLTITDELNRTSSDQVSVIVEKRATPPVAEESGGGGGALNWSILMMMMMVLLKTDNFTNFRSRVMRKK